MPPKMPEIGELLESKYRLLGTIGKGGMGAIYEAEHEAIGKRVAIKVLRPDLAVDEEAVRRFEQEPRAAAATGHRSIIDVYDIGATADGCRFLVMELLEGQSLGKLLDRKGRLKAGLAAYVVAQVLSALHAAHGKKVIHRDLKPDNVFLLKSGQALPDIKLLDFGTSMIVAGTKPGERITESGAVVGTPYYMAPEQITGARDLDPRVDLYAMGVILYECLTGRVPFAASNVYSIVNAIINEPLTPPRELWPELPAPLEAVVLRAMARERGDRYADALEMIEALLPFLDEGARGRVDLPEGLTVEGGRLLEGAETLPTSTDLGLGDGGGADDESAGSLPSGEVEPTSTPARRPKAATVAVGVAVAAALTVVALFVYGPLGGSSEGSGASTPVIVTPAAEGGSADPAVAASEVPIADGGVGDGAPVATSLDGGQVEDGDGSEESRADGSSRHAPPEGGGREGGGREGGARGRTRPGSAGRPGGDQNPEASPVAPADPEPVGGGAADRGGDGSPAPVVPFDTRFE